eukprot:c33623_g1_i1.p1 GENE.c33623_g1_i1~~c33623_g1_i1.p1  ORF type:complete len:204 (-),score=82.27 c33623_g1_i1:339-950(-)
MKFHFCGDLDCPDWILQEIALLSKISAVKMRLLCSQVVSGIELNQTDFEKVNQLTADAKFGESDIKSAVAALRFIFKSSTKFNVDPNTLAKELQQLGLPKEHADGLCKIFVNKKDDIKKALADSSLRLPRVESVQWRLDYILETSSAQSLHEPSIQLKIATTHKLQGNAPQPKNINLEMDQETLALLIQELKIARQIMQKTEA